MIEELASEWKLRLACMGMVFENGFYERTTFDQILTSAANLSNEEQELLAELLQKRRTEKWWEETAAEGRRAVKAFRAGRLKAHSVERAIDDLRASLKERR